MAKVAAHIREARKHGTQAGFDAWYERLNSVTNGGTNGLPQAQELLAEVNRAGKLRKRTGEFAKPEKALQFYCNKYGLTDLPATKRATRATSAGTTRTARTARTAAPAAPAQDDLIEQFKAFIESQGMTPVDTDEDDDEDDVEVPARSERRNVRNVRRQTAAAPATQEFPPPRDPDAPATQGKLWKLNAEGPDHGLFMCVIDEDGNVLAGGESPLTAGECYDLIGEHIA